MSAILVFRASGNALEVALVDGGDWRSRALEDVPRRRILHSFLNCLESSSICRSMASERSRWLLSGTEEHPPIVDNDGDDETIESGQQCVMTETSVVEDRGAATGAAS